MALARLGGPAAGSASHGSLGLLAWWRVPAPHAAAAAAAANLDVPFKKARAFMAHKLGRVLGSDWDWLRVCVTGFHALLNLSLCPL